MDDVKQKRVNDLVVRLRKAVSQIAVKSPTSVRMILDGYLPRISPSLVDAGDSGFPVTVRAHRLDRGRSVQKSRYDVLFFHVGNAIVAYYKTVSGKNQDSSINTLDDRVSFLEAVAREGIEKFHVIGSDAVGYCLESKTMGDFKNLLSEEADALSNKAQQTNPGAGATCKADGGGAGSKGGTPPVRR